MPTDEDKEELMLACRYGDLEDIRLFIDQFGNESIGDIRDENGNCVLHMICGNGHTDVLDYLLSFAPPSLLATKNQSGSTPLHWAALNSHLSIAQKLVEFPDGPGADLIDIKNFAGRSPLGEAEMAGWDEGAKWFVQMMKLEPKSEHWNVANEEEGEEEDTVSGISRNIEVEIEDADGQVAKMTLGETQKSPNSA